MQIVLWALSVVLSLSPTSVSEAIDGLITASQPQWLLENNNGDPTTFQWAGLMAHELVQHYSDDKIFVEIEKRLAKPNLSVVEGKTILRILPMLWVKDEQLQRRYYNLLVSMVQKSETRWRDTIVSLAGIPVDKMPHLATRAHDALLQIVRGSDSYVDVLAAMETGQRLNLPLEVDDRVLLAQFFLQPRQRLSQEFLQEVNERFQNRGDLTSVRVRAVAWLLAEGAVHNTNEILQDLDRWRKLALDDRKTARALAAAVYNFLLEIMPEDDFKQDSRLAQHEFDAEFRQHFLTTHSELLDEYGGGLSDEDVVGGMMYYMYPEEPDAGNRAIMRKIIRQVFEATGPRQHQGEEVTIEKVNEILAAIEQKVVEKFAAGASD